MKFPPILRKSILPLLDMDDFSIPGKSNGLISNPTSSHDPYASFSKNTRMDTPKMDRENENTDSKGSDRQSIVQDKELSSKVSSEVIDGGKSSSKW